MNAKNIPQTLRPQTLRPETLRPDISRRFCVAPMMDWTDRHCRYFHRLLSADALLYTEMVTAAAIIHGDRERLLGFHPAEHPVALQLGGADPKELAEASKIGAGAGYAEINLNVGCPSDRVQNGRFGACLMADPALVASCFTAMQNAAENVPVTVKCRIGIDDQDKEQDLTRFISEGAQAGCKTFIVHARKAWLQGLSPKENRDVPPLDYDRVYRLAAARPDLELIINGGIPSIEACTEHMQHVSGVMLGRAAYHTPALLLEVGPTLFGRKETPVPPHNIVQQMLPYIESELQKGSKLSQITRHMIGLFHGQPGARAYRRTLSERAPLPGAGPEILLEAAAMVEERAMAKLEQPATS